MPKDDKLAMVLGLGEKPKAEDVEAPAEGADVDGFDVASDELFDALKSGDRDAFKEALRSALDMC